MRFTRTRKGRLSVLAVSVALLGAAFAQTAQASLSTAGPVDRNHGYPVYFTDTDGLSLELCLHGPRCLAGTTVRGTPSVPDNIKDEAFWWAAEAAPSGTNANTAEPVEALLVLAQEAAFDSLSGLPRAGKQITFGRIRIRVTGLSNGTYTVNEPFGAHTFTVTDAANTDRDINFSDDRGCLVSPCKDFAAATRSGVGPFLRSTVAPRGYIGDAVSEHPVTGGPNGNTFSITGPGVNLSTNLFVVAGKIAGASEPNLSATSDTGASKRDNVTRDRTPTFRGIAPAGNTVELFSDGNLVGSDVAGGAGRYSITTRRLGRGKHVMKTQATNALDDVSTRSSGLRITIS